MIWYKEWNLPKQYAFQMTALFFKGNMQSSGFAMKSLLNRSELDYSGIAFFSSCDTTVWYNFSRMYQQTKQISGLREIHNSRTSECFQCMQTAQREDCNWLENILYRWEWALVHSNIASKEENNFWVIM